MGWVLGWGTEMPWRGECDEGDEKGRRWMKNRWDGEEATMGGVGEVMSIQRVKWRSEGRMSEGRQVVLRGMDASSRRW